MTGKPTVYDFTWMRGTNTPLIVKFQRGGVGIQFDNAVITVNSNKGRTFAFRASIEEETIVHSDPDAGEITFIPTTAQTRMLTRSKTMDDVGLNTYEIELRQGSTERVHLIGTIQGLGGINDDIDGESED